MSQPAHPLEESWENAVLRLFQPFLLLLATAKDRLLARQVQFLKTENQILRSRLPKRIKVTPAERRRLLR